jgi:D-alanyl-D-alanine carboxypeptidase/D-alanyl-D-alanine-endopeptidase (penicillin-binding protein 4)
VRASGDGSADSARAVAARTLAAFGVAPDELVYRDGSGMSRHDYVTPRALVTVLDAMRRAPTFLLFRDALPIAGVDGNLANRMKGTPAAGNVHAKTGTVDKARSLSGYVTTADGHLVLFSLLCNNFTVSSREVDRVAELLLNATAAFRADGRSNATSR